MAAPVVRTHAGGKPLKNASRKKKTPKRYFDSTDAGDAVEVFEPDLSAFKHGQSSKRKELQGRHSTWITQEQRKKSSVVATKTFKKDRSEKGVSRYIIEYTSATSDDESDKEKASAQRPKRLKKEKSFVFRQKTDPFPGKAPIDPALVKKFARGEAMNTDDFRSRRQSISHTQAESRRAAAAERAARTQQVLLASEEGGWLEPDAGCATCDYSQADIAASVDIQSAQKHFTLDLPNFGPYRLDYTRNGRCLLIGGARGHVAAIDWQTKKLMCEFNVMETVNDVQWLHVPTMFAVAQKQWTYIYDGQGIELHCLKVLDCVRRLEFLPYHFLLAAAGEKGYLSYIDISVGQKVAGTSTGLGRLDVMCQNPDKAIVHLGHSGGTVTLWSPNVKEPLVKMLCHGSSTRAVAVDRTGLHMATSGTDRTIKVWDLRTYKELAVYRVACGASSLSFSQRGGLLAASLGNVVDIYRNVCGSAAASQGSAAGEPPLAVTPYLTYSCVEQASEVAFCPYEDVLGVTHVRGFASLLVPGAGEPNFDGLEVNPYQTSEQRRQAEVKMLLEKIPAEMIDLDHRAIAKIDVASLKNKLDVKNQLPFLKKREAPVQSSKRLTKKEREKQRRQLVQESVASKQSDVKADKLATSSIGGRYDALSRFARQS